MKPKVLLFDIETSPNLAYVWGKYQQDVVAFEEEWKIIDRKSTRLNSSH